MEPHAYLIHINAGSQTAAVRDYLIANPHTVRYDKYAPNNNDTETLRAEPHPISDNVVLTRSCTDPVFLKAAASAWVGEAIHALTQQLQLDKKGALVFCASGLSKVMDEGVFGNIQF